MRSFMHIPHGQSDGHGPEVLNTNAEAFHKRQPRTSLRKGLTKWMLLLITAPMLASGITIYAISSNHLRDSTRQDMTLMSQLMSATLSGRLSDGWTTDDRKLVDSMGRHPRLAYVWVLGANDEIIHASVFDSDAWGRYMAKSQTNVGEPTPEKFDPLGWFLPEEQEVWTTPIFTTPLEVGGGSKAQLEGKVVAGLKKGTQRLIFSKIGVWWLGELALVWLICVAVLPLVLHRWIKPLKALMAATRKLALGETPEQIPLRTSDEMGFLVGAFNDMAAKLTASRSMLIETNKNLEHRVAERTQELNEAAQNAERMARTDSLTSIYNRRAFTEELPRAVSRVKTNNLSLSLMMIDLDGFKGVNDTLGHDVGDKLLVLVSGILQRCSPKGAMVARLGGDEFAILLGNVATDHAKKIGEGMIQAFVEEAKAIFAKESSCPPASLSIGLANRTPQDRGPATELLKRADQALYKAKAAGKSRVEIFHPDLELEAERNAQAVAAGDRRKPR
jgi:diguanylate cyclase (GGDEF)-like protein